MHDREGGGGGEGEREEERGEEGGRGGGRRRGKRRGKRRGNIYVHVDTIKQRSSVLAAVVTIPLQPALNVYPPRYMVHMQYHSQSLHAGILTLVST